MEVKVKKEAERYWKLDLQKKGKRRLFWPRHSRNV